MAYALRVEEQAAEFHAQMVAVGVAAALGGDVPLPRWSQVRADFDADLAEPPADERPRPETGREIKLRALGVG